jgi:hypothetical protein
MKKGIGAILTGSALLLALLLLGWFNLSKPRILVLHSSDRNSSIVKKMDAGIRSVLDKNRQPLSLRWHYLGIDSLPDEDHREDAAKEGTRAVEQFDPDAIIAVDDEAQQYVARHYAGRSRPKIIFTAIDHDPKEYGYAGAANVTGVVEILPLPAISDTLMQARQGQPARIAVLASLGVTGKGQLKQVEAFNWAPHKLVEVHALGDFAAWQAAIKAMEGQVDAVLVLSHEGLRASPAVATPVAPGELVRWIEANARPLPIGISTDYVELGGGLSIAPSVRAMGEVAAADTLRWLKAKPADPAPPVSEGKHYSVAIRPAALQARNVKLPSIYVEAARLNQLYFP